MNFYFVVNLREYCHNVTAMSQQEKTTANPIFIGATTLQRSGQHRVHAPSTWVRYWSYISFCLNYVLIKFPLRDEECIFMYCMIETQKLSQSPLPKMVV